MPLTIREKGREREREREGERKRGRKGGRKGGRDIILLLNMEDIYMYVCISW